MTLPPSIIIIMCAVAAGSDVVRNVMLSDFETLTYLPEGLLCRLPQSDFKWTVIILLHFFHQQEKQPKFLDFRKKTADTSRF